jgi:hypothetical protein
MSAWDVQSEGDPFARLLDTWKCAIQATRGFGVDSGGSALAGSGGTLWMCGHQLWFQSIRIDL